MEINQEYIDAIVKEAVERVFEVESWGRDEEAEFWIFKGRFRTNPIAASNYLQATFEPLKFFVAIKKEKGDTYKIVILKQRPVSKSNIAIHLVLFLATLITTFFWGSIYEFGDFPDTFWQFLQGYKFALPLLLILGGHELGHFFASRYHRVDATLPYFIPFPFNIIGTLGAFIKIKSPIPSRNVLIDIGASGPIVGILIAIPVAIIGLKTSSLEHVSRFAEGGLMLGTPLLFQIVTILTLGKDVLTSQEYALSLSSTAFAAWVGMFVTALNLIPVGQLDGGHISYAIFGSKARKISIFAVLLLVFLGIFVWQGWLFWALFLMILGVSHPAPMNDILPVDGKRKLIAAIALLLLILTFTPRPFFVSGQ